MRLITILLLYLTSFSSYANPTWHDLEDFKYRYECLWGEQAGSVVFLGGTAKQPAVASPITVIPQTQGLFDSLGQDCYVLVAPETPTHIVEGVTYKMWDMSDNVSLGADTVYLAKLLIRAHGLEGKTYLVGGSNGAIAAYKVANFLRVTGHGDILEGLVLVDGISPYTISDNSNKPALLGNLESSIKFSTFGFTYWRADNWKYDYILLGMASNKDTWNTRTLIEYSSNDTTIPADEQLYFAITLSRVAESLTIKQFGESHSVGEAGWSYIYEWITYED